MAGIDLDNLPKGKEFEEYLAAYFQEQGYYIEKNIIERHGGDEVLEIDLALTNYDKKPLEMNLIEAKSGKSKFSDIFKVRGWMYYLNFDKGIFISQEKSDDFDFQRETAKTINIDLVQIGELKNTDTALKGIAGLCDKKVDIQDFRVWRYVYWIERALLKRLNIWKKSVKDKECYKIMEDYHFKAHNDVFFNANIIQRLSGLYDTFHETPRLTAHVGNECDGKRFYERCSDLPSSIFSASFYRCEYNPVQISTYVEHKTRLSILKNAIDYQLFKNAGDTNLTNNEIIRRDEMLGLRFEYTLIDNLPMNFMENLNIISQDEYFHRYPIFWQTFLWLFGGFILNDYKEEEYKLLSEKSGIPIDEIPAAFQSYERLFPLKKGWFMEIPNSNITIMKMFPIPFRGMGAHYRKVKFTEKSDYNELDLTGDKTFNDLIKWNGLAYNVLKEDLKLKK